MTSQTSKNNYFPYWSIPLGLMALMLFVAIMGPALGYLYAFAIVSSMHLIVGCGAFAISMFLQKNLPLNITVGVGVFFILVFASLVLQGWLGIYTPLFRFFYEIGEAGRSIAVIGLFCSSGFLIIVAIIAALVFGLNWTRVGKAIAAQPGIDSLNKK